MGGTDYSFDGLTKIEKQLTKMINEQYPKELKNLLLEIAKEVLADTIEKTPKDTPHLVSNWQLGTITRVGNAYEIEIFNNVEYAEFVEYGHRLEDGGFQEGAFMLELSLEEMNDLLPKKLQMWLDDFLEKNKLY